MLKEADERSELKSEPKGIRKECARFFLNISGKRIVGGQHSGKRLTEQEKGIAFFLLFILHFYGDLTYGD